MYNELNKTFKDILFLTVDADIASEHTIGEINRIQAVPTFHLYQNGKIIEKINGNQTMSLKNKLKKLSESSSNSKRK
jgi:thioredoxin-like negative regulator of GroEL